jgi:membrane-bound serine protease (ClpP class)
MQALGNLIYQFVTNPNIAYLFLILGLWCAVLAITAPGTGLPETAAVVSLVLAAVGLFALPTNLVGLGLILLSMALFFAETRFPSHGALITAGGIVMVLGGLLLFPGDRSAESLSWITILSAPLFSSVLFGLLISAGLAVQGRPALQDLRRLIGAHGVTRTEVSRQGTVYVAGEDWSATSETKIPPDTDVVVLTRSGLRLTVAPATPGNAPGAAAAASKSSAGQA